ncbi:MAG TPA: S8 family peptidase [Blastocatellia bacterium]|jgi:subtilisin family serine protease|nr:S8 family peptidase [Blastocatellia bacterium]
MKKYAVLCVCLALASALLMPRQTVYSQAREATGRAYVEGEIIIKFKENAEPILDEQISEEVLKVRGARIESLSRRARGGISRIHLDENISVEEAVAQAKADPRVEYAEPNYLLYATDTTPNDTYFTRLWGMSNTACPTCDNTSRADIGATRAWDITTGSDDLVVGVVDTGIDLSHPDLAPNAWVNPREIDGNNIDDDGDGYVDDMNGWNFFNDSKEVYKERAEDLHGTHVAGTIGAVGNNATGVTGVAWHVKLMSLKFLGGKDGKGSTGDAVKAINYAIDQKQRGVNLRVLNASWGGGGDSMALREAISAAGDAGIVFVCAAGNDGEDGDWSGHFPSGYARDLSSCVSVAAIDSSDNLASFSNYGHGTVSVAAPGYQILSTLPGGGYGSLSGTSMASPHVAGIAALLLSKEPSLTPAEVKQRIIMTAEPIPALVSKAVSSGRVNAFDVLTGRVAPAPKPNIVSVVIEKKSVTIDGLGFLSNSSIVEVNGSPLPGISYDNSYSLANGTITRLSLELGKKVVKKTFPKGQYVNFTVLNSTTGERSTQFSTVRF